VPNIGGSYAAQGAQAAYELPEPLGPHEVGAYAAVARESPASP